MTTATDPKIALEKLTCIYQQLQALYPTTTPRARCPAFQHEMNKADSIYKQIMLKSLLAIDGIIKSCTGLEAKNNGASLEEIVNNLSRYERPIALVEERIVLLISINPPDPLPAQWWKQFFDYSI